MRLLVSVRSGSEAVAAVSGGAGIVDAKEPAHGPLGAVGAGALREIAAAVPLAMPLSVALGDLSDPSAAGAALEGLGGVGRGRRELYVKVGLAGVRNGTAARAVLAAVVQAAAATELRPAVVAVAYADHEAAGAPPRDAVGAAASAAGARGVLLDTWIKDGRDLFAWIAADEIERWIDESRRCGLLTAVAGSLSLDAIGRAASLRADILGVRGAACAGGRTGTVEERRVRALAAALGEARRLVGARP